MISFSNFFSSWVLFSFFVTSCRAFISSPATTPARTSTTSTSTLALYAVKTDEELLPIVREGLEDKSWTDDWDTCVKILQESFTDISSEESEIILSKALGWRGWAIVSSPMMRKYVKPKQPNPTQLTEAINWLQSEPLSLSTDVLLEAIRTSPEAYLLEPQTSFTKSLKSVPTQLASDEETYIQLLNKDPSVLENTYNCVDEGCASNCGNCWVSYELSQN